MNAVNPWRIQSDYLAYILSGEKSRYLYDLFDRHKISFTLHGWYSVENIMSERFARYKLLDDTAGIDHARTMI
jgi:hypothetical protein